jgi:hypothetical protein
VVPSWSKEGDSTIITNAQHIGEELGHAWGWMYYMKHWNSYKFFHLPKKCWIKKNDNQFVKS